MRLTTVCTLLLLLLALASTTRADEGLKELLGRRGASASVPDGGAEARAWDLADLKTTTPSDASTTTTSSLGDLLHLDSSGKDNKAATYTNRVVGAVKDVANDAAAYWRRKARRGGAGAGGGHSNQEPAAGQEQGQEPGQQQGQEPDQEAGEPSQQPDSEQPSEGSTGGDAGSLKEVLDAHNQYRSRHGVPALSWSDSIAAQAQSYSARCVFDHSGTQGVGENLARGYKSWTSVLQGWYQEESEYNYNDAGFTHGTGHFTQMVWRSSTQLGCGVSSCGGSPLSVCQYAPAGNVQGRFQQNVPPPSSSA